MGDADGELFNRGGHQDARSASIGPVLGPGGRKDEEENWSSGEGGGAMPSPQWSQFLSGEFEISEHCL